MKKSLIVLGLVSTAILAGCGMNSQVAKIGDVVYVDYIGSLEDGTIFDTSIEAKAKEAGKLVEGRTYEPLKMTV